MAKRGPDFQKKEAKQSLWDMDGQHIPKRYRNKGKGRGKDKKMIEQELKELAASSHLTQEEAWDEEVREAIYCDNYGPCKKCKEK